MASIIKADTLQSTTANVFVLNSSGTEYARFDSGGKFNVANALQSNAFLTSVTANSVAMSQESGYGRIAAFGPNSSTAGTLYMYTIDSAGANQRGMIIDSSGQVGIGTTNPLAKLNVIDSTGCNLYIGYSGGGGTNYYQSNGGQFFTNGTGTTQYAMVNPYGIGVGTATPTNGTGVTFPATQDVSSNANTLDDYEEGTWTPTLTSSAGTITSYTSSGYYVKIGKQVTVWCNVKITNLGTGSGSVSIASMPFTVNATDLYGIVAFGRETDVSGVIWQGWTTSGGNGFNVLTAANGGLIAVNYRYIGSVTYTV